MSAKSGVVAGDVHMPDVVAAGSRLWPNFYLRRLHRGVTLNIECKGLGFATEMEEADWGFWPEISDGEEGVRKEPGSGPGIDGFQQAKLALKTGVRRTGPVPGGSRHKWADKSIRSFSVLEGVGTSLSKMSTGRNGRLPGLVMHNLRKVLKSPLPAPLVVSLATAVEIEARAEL